MTPPESEGAAHVSLIREPLLLTAREAARLLSVCERTLWGLTDRGDLPAVRIGRVVRYDPADLRRWIEQQKQK